MNLLGVVAGGGGGGGGAGDGIGLAAGGAGEFVAAGVLDAPQPSRVNARIEATASAKIAQSRRIIFSLRGTEVMKFTMGVAAARLAWLRLLCASRAAFTG